jgi:hypothetical protein
MCVETRFLLFPVQGLDGNSPTMLSTAQNSGGRLLRTLRTKAADGGATPLLGRHSVSSALPCIALPVEARAGYFSEGVFEGIFEDVYLCGSTVFPGPHRAANAQS